MHFFIHMIQTKNSASPPPLHSSPLFSFAPGSRSATMVADAGGMCGRGVGLRAPNCSCFFAHPLPARQLLRK